MATYNLDTMNNIIYNGTNLSKLYFNGTLVWVNGLIIENGAVVQNNGLNFTGCSALASTATQPLGVSYHFSGSGLGRACVYANEGIDVTPFSSVTVTTSCTGYSASFGYNTSKDSGSIGTVLTTSSGTNTYSLVGVTGVKYFGWEQHAYSAISGTGQVTYMRFNR